MERLYFDIAFQDNLGFFDLRLKILGGITKEKLLEVEDGLSSLLDTAEGEDCDLSDCVYRVLDSLEIPYSMPQVEYTIML
jgi:hypothetical protein